MKLARVLKTALAVLALAPVVSWAGTGLALSAHDFTAGVMGTPNAQPIGLCTYCHTPHKAQSTLLLWNHTLSSNNFGWDVAQTTAGTPFPTLAGASYAGPSTKCLSCHDGSVAVGDIAWFNAAPQPAANGFKLGTTTPDTSHVVGASGAMKGNHPIGMPYPYAGAPNTYNGKTNGAELITADFVAAPAAPIRLFNQVNAVTVAAGPASGTTGIECSSCHDPHNKQSVTGQDFFLRGNLTGSTIADGYICVKCHIK